MRLATCFGTLRLPGGHPQWSGCLKDVLILEEYFTLNFGFSGTLYLHTTGRAAKTPRLIKLRSFEGCVWLKS